jgi:hypothetical protein
MDDSSAPARMPKAVDPAAAPKWLSRVATSVSLAGVVLLLVAAQAATNEADPNRGDPLVSPGTLVTLGLASVAAAALLLFIYLALGWRRLRHYERRYGFLPREGRKERPKTGRTTLVRVEYGSSGSRLCLMLARWDYTAEGWRRGRVVEHVWEESDDEVAIGEQRARLEALAESLEEDFDDARLAGDGERQLTDEVTVERRAESERSRRLAEALAREGDSG